MRDPAEGLTKTGVIVTGAARDRVPAPFEPVLARASRALASLGPSGSLYVYGSVATGRARLAHSDVDLLTIDVSAEDAAAIGAELSGVFRTVCRAVEVAIARRDDYERSTDESYGNRVFLRHYCVHVAGPVRPVDPTGFVGDVRAARGFNGDIAAHARRWRSELDAGADADVLARRVARKTLLALTGLVSVHDRTWTTDRGTAAARWVQIEPRDAEGVEELLAWIDAPADVSAAALRRSLDATIDPIVAAFASAIGLWS